MGRRGTKPAPTAIKLLKGTQPCRMNPAEPLVPGGVPEPPGYLDGAALELWHELAPTLAEAGVLKTTDRHALALLCESFQLCRADHEDLKRRAEFRRLLAEFGLTPSSRGGIKVESKGETDALAGFLSKRKV